MLRTAMFASALALTFASPVLAQSTATAPGNLTAAQTGVSPMTGVTPTDYVRLAADSDMYEIQSSRLALSRSKRDNVKAFAKQMIADHTTTSKALMAALKNGERNIAKPPMKLSPDNAAKIALLKKAPKASFDDLYLQQQMAAHQTAWSLHTGFAMNGADPALRQVAMTAVPIIERHFSHVRQMAPAGMAPAR